ncbi:MAG TPA: 3,4-dihydroxy-2-butanone-4-phosphate synthase [Gammaproteobacteria bacterium]|nr:3,4-dihydroxy-2-butanone-4-phosphate synthase [Gammaproteobacteria bacterium]
MPFNTIEEITQDLRDGKMVVILDDEDRENEGDLLMAASMVRPEDINFMAQYGRGLICLTLTQERCKQLDLPLMVGRTGDLHGTNFTLSIEAAEGVTTGISAYDRAHTVRSAVAPNAVPADIVQPGHVFPLKAQAGGVLTRAGHTEAGCDLARIAGLEPAAVIVEILNEDGSMARKPDLEKFAALHNLKMGTIEDLIHYRVHHEKSVHRVAETLLPTEFGDFNLIAYENQISGHVHFALVMGEVAGHDPVMVRVHLQDALADILPVSSSAFGWPLRDALQRIANEGKGVAVILRQPEADSHLVARIKNIEHAKNTGQEKTSAGPEDVRTFGIGAQILSDLGVHRMRLLSSPKKFHALGGFDLEVEEYIWDEIE